jgi:hypothetical protein
VPPRKKLTKPTTAKRVGNTLTPQFPSRGGKCNHPALGCFKVRLHGVEGNDTFHHFDEGGAVLFAMQQSRNNGYTASVTGPDGKEICVFRARTYDVAKVRREFWERNEKSHIGGDVYTDRNRAAAEARATATKKALSKTPPKKKVLKKR